MNTLTTFLAITSTTMLFLLIVQAITIKKLRKLIKNNSDIFLRYQVLSAFYKKSA